MNNLRGNPKGLTMAKGKLARVNKLSLLIKSQISPPKSDNDLYSDALYVFISRMMEGGYNEEV